MMQTIIRFTVKRKKPLCQYEQDGFGYDNPGLLVAASSHGSQYEIVIGYVELLPIQLGGERREAVAVIYIKC